MNNTFQRTLMLGSVAVVALTVFGGNVRSASAATTMRGAVSVTTDMGSLGADSFASGVGSSPQSMIDRAGLLRAYTDGEDQAAYLNLTPSNLASLHSDRSTREWFSAAGVTSGNVTFNLGALYTLENVVIWNEDTFGIKNFDILASNNAGFVGATNLRSATAFNQEVTSLTVPTFLERAQVFSFTPTAAQFIRLVIKDTYDYESPNRDEYTTPLGFRSASIGEVAFGLQSPNVVPTPALLPGLIGLGATAWRKRRQLAAK